MHGCPPPLQTVFRVQGAGFKVQGLGVCGFGFLGCEALILHLGCELIHFLLVFLLLLGHLVELLL